jgi:hypothetical protein
MVNCQRWIVITLNCLKLIWIFYFLFFIAKKRLNNMARQHTIPWNKVRAVPSILHTVGVNEMTLTAFHRFFVC